MLQEITSHDVLEKSSEVLNVGAKKKGFHLLFTLLCGKSNAVMILLFFKEKIGVEYPEQQPVESPLAHNLSASGSPIAIDSRPNVKMEGTRDAMALGTWSTVPTTVTSMDSEVDSINPSNHHLASLHLQSSAVVTSVMPPPVTTLSDMNSTAVLPAAGQQPKLQDLLNMSTPARTRTPTVREMLPPNSSAPQTLQQTIIIKPPPQILPHANQPGSVADPGALVNHHQAVQAVQALQDGQKLFIQSFPVLTQQPIPVAVSSSHLASSDQTGAMTGPQQIVQPRPHDISLGRDQPTPTPATAFTGPVVCQSNSAPLDTNPLSVLSATAAEKQPLPVPDAQSAPPSRPPASNLHVIQPASVQHEVMDTTPTPNPPESTPIQVEDDWDPFAELKQQCTKKLRFLEQKKYVDHTNSARLNIIKGE